MYLLFRYKNIKPSEFNEMGRGEKIILKSFMKLEIEDRKKSTDAFN